MKIVNFGTNYQIYSNDIHTYDELPAATYLVSFSKASGFFLQKIDTVEVNEKSYGSFAKRIGKVLSTYNQLNRNLGLILSGDKGIGKSFFAKRLTLSAIDMGLPVIIVSSYIPGIANFLNSITQRCLILFDEFDKTFVNSEESNSMGDPQTEMLTLFDGINNGEKLFVITCNNIWSLNSYLLNRPGRFHYHFRFTYPTKEEVREYLTDHITQNYNAEEVEKVVRFSTRVHLTYDCLRAIAFELSLGETFQTALEYLNILATDDTRYTAKITFENGKTCYYDFICHGNQAYDEDDDEIRGNTYSWNNMEMNCRIRFNLNNIVTGDNDKMYIPTDKITITEYGVTDKPYTGPAIVSCDILPASTNTYTYKTF